MCKDIIREDIVSEPDLEKEFVEALSCIDVNELERVLIQNGLD